MNLSIKRQEYLESRNKEIIKLYQEGMPSREIAQKFNLTMEAICAIRRKLNIPSHSNFKILNTPKGMCKNHNDRKAVLSNLCPECAKLYRHHRKMKIHKRDAELDPVILRLREKYRKLKDDNSDNGSVNTRSESIRIDDVISIRPKMQPESYLLRQHCYNY